jgi:hypothetical protein
VFSNESFERSFRTPREILEKLRAGVLSADAGYVTQKIDAVGVRGASADQNNHCSPSTAISRSWS